MNSYLIMARIPKNVKSYLQKFKKEIINICIQRKWECIVEYLSGRIIIFSNHDPCEFVLKIKNVISCRKVLIFNMEEYSALVQVIINLLKKKRCNDFAVKSNRKEMEMKIGEDITTHLDIAVNLENSDCQITVEKREDYYLLLM